MDLQLFAVDPVPDLVYQGLMTAVEAILYTVPAGKKLVKEIIIANNGPDSKLYLSYIPNATVANAGNANRIVPGRLVVTGDTIILALTSPLKAGWSITGKSDLANNICITISVADA